MPVAWLVIAFLSGSIPWGYLIARRREGIDIREKGSGNIGATNVTRVLGFKVGAWVLILDILKGSVPLYAMGRQGFDMPWLMAAGLAAVSGHIFTPWLGFKGGRGIATWFGILPFILGWFTLLPLLVFFAVAVPTRVVGLASVLAVFGFFIALMLDPQTSSSLPAFLLGVGMGALLLWRHRENIHRILEGKEKAL